MNTPRVLFPVIVFVLSGCAADAALDAQLDARESAPLAVAGPADPLDQVLTLSLEPGLERPVAVIDVGGMPVAVVVQHSLGAESLDARKFELDLSGIKAFALAATDKWIDREDVLKTLLDDQTRETCNGSRVVAVGSLSDGASSAEVFVSFQVLDGDIPYRPDGRIDWDEIDRRTRPTCRDDSSWFSPFVSCTGNCPDNTTHVGASCTPVNVGLFGFGGSCDCRGGTRRG